MSLLADLLRAALSLVEHQPTPTPWTPPKETVMRRPTPAQSTPNGHFAAIIHTSTNRDRNPVWDDSHTSRAKAVLYHGGYRAECCGASGVDSDLPGHGPVILIEHAATCPQYQ